MKDVLFRCHHEPGGGHLGVKKTIEKVKQKFYWVGCLKSVADWAANCKQCIKAKSSIRESHGRIHQSNSGASEEEAVKKVAKNVGFSNKPERYEGNRGELQKSRNEFHGSSRQQMQVVGNRMKARYDCVSYAGGLKEGQLVVLFNPQRKEGLGPESQSPWEGPYKVINRINDVVYRIQKEGSPRAKMKVVHLERLAQYGRGLEPVRDEQA